MAHISGQTIHTQLIIDISRTYDTKTDQPLQTTSHGALPQSNIPAYLCLRGYGPALADEPLPRVALPRRTAEIHLCHLGTESTDDRTEISSCDSHDLIG